MRPEDRQARGSFTLVLRELDATMERAVGSGPCSCPRFFLNISLNSHWIKHRTSTISKSIEHCRGAMHYGLSTSNAKSFVCSHIVQVFQCTFALNSTVLLFLSIKDSSPPRLKIKFSSVCKVTKFCADGSHGSTETGGAHGAAWFRCQGMSRLACP